MSGATIFCAKCGAAGQRVNSYCRSCGEWLPDPAAPTHLPARLRRLSPERKQRRLQTLQILSALAAAAAAFITLAVHFGLHEDMLVLAPLLCLVVVAWQGVAFFILRSIQGRRAQETSDSAPALPATPPAAPPPALGAADTEDLLRPPSVTESTTALLERRPARQSGEE